MKNEKVYCKNCKYLNESLIIGNSECEYPKNIKRVSTWYKQSNGFKKFAWYINRKNNCKWYEEK